MSANRKEFLKAPFPWFGGKSRVASLVWQRFGRVASLNDPFCGSLAMVLGCPHPARIETVNDIDCYLANFWRALQHDPEGVAAHADWPVNEADLHARHRWLVEVARPIAERVMADPDFYDVKIAGWWVWGQCLWIGSGWCQRPEWQGRANAGREARGIHADRVNGKSEHRTTNGYGKAGYGEEQRRRPHLTGEQGIISTRRGGDTAPYLGKEQRTAATFGGENPHEQHKRPKLRGRGDDGIAYRRWQGGGQGGGSGVHAPRLAARGELPQQKPSISGDSGASGNGIHAVRFARTEGLYDYLRALAKRLRRVRVCCGDWKRVLTPSVTTYIGLTGVFLDPPYDHALRERCYSEDHNVSAEVREWALANGDNPKLRIALCGYEGEHDQETVIERAGQKVTIPPMPATWECLAWKAHGGYSRTERGRANREKERVWFSPHCLKVGLELWDGLEAIPTV